MATILNRPLTREDYRRLPEGPPYFELIDGELVEMTRGTQSHSELPPALVALWAAHLRSGPGGWIAWEPNLFLPGTENVYHPDLVYIGADQGGIRRGDGIYGTSFARCCLPAPSGWTGATSWRRIVGPGCRTSGCSTRGSR